jgi:hypothetical protein
MRKWERLKEVRFKETVVSYTSDCNKYVICKVYAYGYDDNWGVEFKNHLGKWTILREFDKFKDAKEYANKLI